MNELNEEAILRQLGYNPNDSILNQFQKVINSTPGFNELKRSIIALNEKIKHYGGFIGLSSSTNYLKIKNVTSSPQTKEIIDQWAKKHKVSLIKSANNNYYIEGKQD